MKSLFQMTAPQVHWYPLLQNPIPLLLYDINLSNLLKLLWVNFYTLCSLNNAKNYKCKEHKIRVNTCWVIGSRELFDVVIGLVVIGWVFGVGRHVKFAFLRGHEYLFAGVCMGKFGVVIDVLLLLWVHELSCHVESTGGTAWEVENVFEGCRVGLVWIVHDFVFGIVDLECLRLVDDLELWDKRFSGNCLKVL